MNINFVKMAMFKHHLAPFRHILKYKSMPILHFRPLQTCHNAMKTLNWPSQHDANSY